MIVYGGERYVLGHPLFQETLREMEGRSMLATEWVEVVEIEKVDAGLF